MRRPRALIALVLTAGVSTSLPVRAAQPSEDLVPQRPASRSSEPAPSSAGPEVSEGYAQGQAKLEAGDFAGAAEIWEKLLETTDEGPATTSVRENLMINVIDARIQAYERQVGATGEREPLHLLTAQVSLRRYYREYSSAYGDSRAVSPSVQERADDLRRAMDTALPPRTGVSGYVPAPWESDTSDRRRQEAPQAAQKNGSGLLVGGVGLGVLGLSVGLTMIPLGAVLGRNAEGAYVVARTEAITSDEETERALALAEAREARRAGRTANRVTVAGAVLSPLLLGGAAAMIVFGLQRRQRAVGDVFVQHSPAVSPTYAGWNTTVRF